MHGIYILDVMKLDAACVKCSQPLCQQLKACVEEREVRSSPSLTSVYLIAPCISQPCHLDRSD